METLRNTFHSVLLVQDTKQTSKSVKHKYKIKGIFQGNLIGLWCLSNQNPCFLALSLPTVYNIPLCVWSRRTFADVGIRVGETGRLSRLPPEQAPQVGPRLVSAPLGHRVTLRALGDEHLLPLGDVAHDWQTAACVNLTGTKQANRITCRFFTTFYSQKLRQCEVTKGNCEGLKFVELQQEGNDRMGLDLPCPKRVAREKTN